MENKKIAEIIMSQLHLFLLSGLYGIMLGIWYEVFRTLRKTFVHRNRIVHLEDIIFCFTAAGGLFFLFQIFNQGMIRFYCLLGLECGTILYFCFLSKWTGKILFCVIKFISNIVKIVSNTLLFPVKLIVKNTGKILKNMQKTIKIIKRHK